MTAQLVATSTSASALDSNLSQKVAVASDGTALVIYYDGTEMVWRSAVSPYSTWSSATTLPSSGGTRYNAGLHYNSSDNSLDVIYHDASGQITYVKLTYNSGTHTWSAGTAVTVTATGGGGSSGEALWIGKDGSGNLWVVSYQTTTSWEAYYSSNGGTTWTASITAASEGGTSADQPTAVICGSANQYVLVVYSHNNGQLAWRRCDTSSSLTTWSAEQLVNLGTNPDFYAGDLVSLATDGSGRAVLVMSSQAFNFGSGVWGKVYTPSTDTWGADTHLGTHTGGTFSDNWGFAASDGTNVWAVYSAGAAANSYALDFKKWTNTSATWDASATQLEPSGNNITFVNAFASGGTLYFAYVQGTASPYSIYFDTANVSGSTHVTHTANGALAQLSQHTSHTASGALAQLKQHVSHTASGVLAQLRTGGYHVTSGAFAQLSQHNKHTASGALANLKQHNQHTTSFASAEIAKIPPMPVISRSQPAYASDITYAPSRANDSDYGTLWTTGTAPSVGSPAYWAVDLSSVPASQRQNVVLVWYGESGDGYWVTGGGNLNNCPKDYTIQTNTAAGGTYPTSGWTTVATVTSNPYWSREHAFNLAGANWVQIVVTASSGVTPNNGVTFQVDIHDAHQGDVDDALMLGDSITAEAWVRRDIDGTGWTNGPTPQQIATAFPLYFPLMLDGGFGGMTMSWGATNVASLIAPFSGHFISIAYGTNDLNVGFQMSTSQLASVYTNLLTILDAIVAAGKKPIVPYVPWGSNNSGYLGINAQAFNTYVDAHLPSDRAGQYLRGPDLYTAFYTHQSLIRDGIHPTYAANSDGTQTGYDLYHRVWRDWWLANVYATPLQSHSATGVMAQLTRTSGAIHTYHTASGWVAQIGFPNPHIASGVLAQLKVHNQHTTSGALAQLKQHATHTASGAQAQLTKHNQHTASGALVNVSRHNLHTTSGAQAQLTKHNLHTASGALAQLTKHNLHTASGALAQLNAHLKHTASGALAQVSVHNTHSASGALAQLHGHPQHTASGVVAQLVLQGHKQHTASSVLAQLKQHNQHSAIGFQAQVRVHNAMTASGAVAQIKVHNTHSASGVKVDLVTPHVQHSASGILAQLTKHNQHSASSVLAQIKVHNSHTASGVLVDITHLVTHSATGALAQIKQHTSHSASGALANVSRHNAHTASGVVADLLNPNIPQTTLTTPGLRVRDGSTLLYTR